MKSPDAAIIKAKEAIKSGGKYLCWTRGESSHHLLKSVCALRANSKEVRWLVGSERS